MFYMQTPTTMLARHQSNEALVYEEISSLEKEDGLKLIKLAAPERGSKILDLGCGTGYLSKKMSDIVGPKGKVIGIDPNPYRLQLARKKYVAPSLVFQEGSAEVIPGEAYDLVFTNHVLHWCKNRPRAFAEIARCLKPKGKIACSCCLQSDSEDDTFKFVSQEHQKYLATFVTEAEFHEFEMEYHFKTTHKSVHECVHSFNTVEDYIRFFSTHQKFDESDFDLSTLHHKLARKGKLFCPCS